MTGVEHRPSIRLAVLDMGGTTIRNDGTIEEALAEAVRLASPDPIGAGEARQRVAEARHLRGAAKIDLLRAALGGEEAPARRALVILDRLLHDAIDGGALEAMPGATDVLGWLHRHDIEVCLATGFTPEVRDHLIEARGWADLVDLAISPDDAGRGRPHPDMVLAAAGRLGIGSLQEVVVVGDTVNDLLAGTRAGAGLVVGVLSGAHSRERLADAPHTHLIQDIGGLPTILTQRTAHD